MDFLKALKNRRSDQIIPVIPDIKSFSPKEGDLLCGRDPMEYAKMLVGTGAPVLSVVTEEKEFHGSMKMLQDICGSVNVPVLRKDFIEDVRDLDETKDAGASAVLLMVSCLGEEKLAFLYQEAVKRNLLPFVETHKKEELDFAIRLGTPLIGINNRDILKLERDDGDVRHAAELLKSIPKEIFTVAESALSSPADVRYAIEAGADACLVGTAILQAKDPEAMYQAMSRKCSLKICGVKNETDVRICGDLQADMIGFVVDYPVNVPWNIAPEQAKPLIRIIKEEYLGLKTCIVTGGSTGKVIRLAGELQPDLVQLHYTESKEETAAAAAALHDLGIRVIRSIPSDKSLRTQMFGTDALFEIIALPELSDVDCILLDSRDANNAAKGGGTISVTEEELRAVRSADKTIMIGGGINASNIKELTDLIRPDAVDIMTASEDAPGHKSVTKIRDLLKQWR